MTKALATKPVARKDAAGTTPEDSPASRENATTESSGPIWKTQHNRVQGAMWKHDQKGKVRYTVSISRSYKDRETDQWVSVHYFDSQDLRDVVSVANEARDYVLGLDGMEEVAGNR